jgi:hypothetical protein
MWDGRRCRRSHPTSSPPARRTRRREHLGSSIQDRRSRIAISQNWHTTATVSPWKGFNYLPWILTPYIQRFFQSPSSRKRFAPRGNSFPRQQRCRPALTGSFMKWKAICVSPKQPLLANSDSASAHGAGRRSWSRPTLPAGPIAPRAARSHTNERPKKRLGKELGAGAELMKRWTCASRLPL